MFVEQFVLCALAFSISLHVVISALAALSSLHTKAKQIIVCIRFGSETLGYIFIILIFLFNSRCIHCYLLYLKSAQFFPPVLLLGISMFCVFVYLILLPKTVCFPCKWLKCTGLQVSPDIYSSSTKKEFQANYVKIHVKK